MKKYSQILIIANLLILLGYFNWSVYKKEQTLKSGQLVLMELYPIDPRSLIQGDYMRLNYAKTGFDLIDEYTPSCGYALLRTDSNHIGQVVRLQRELKPIGNNELAIRYKIVYHTLIFGTESFFFEEGQSLLYDRAKYGGLRVNDKGESLLVGLYDEDLKLIQP